MIQGKLKLYFLSLFAITSKTWSANLEQFIHFPSFLAGFGTKKARIDQKLYQKGPFCINCHVFDEYGEGKEASTHYLISLLETS